MGDDRDDATPPGGGPGDLPGPDWGASVTIDSDGHLRKIGVNTPGGEATIDLDRGQGQDAAHDPGWMPNIPHPGEPQVDPFALSPGPGWHRDPVTGIPLPDAVGGPDAAGPDLLRMRSVDEGATEGPGDFPPPNPDESPA